MDFDFLKGKRTCLEEKVKEHSIQNSAGSKLEYLKILDTYGVSWTMEKAARDTIQNFFDANNSTLDGINVILANDGDNYTIRIHGGTEYDFRRLTHLGGTTKFNNEFTAGSFGEGAKILALVLLRDYGFSQVRFGSQNWELDFLLKELPEGEYVEQRKGLFAFLNQKEEKFPGNFVEFKTKNKGNAEIFAEAKELFYSSKNQDFQSSSLDIPGVGGFKYLPRQENSDFVPKGNFYHVGQRRHFEEEKWQNVEHVNLWTHSNNILSRDRDRGIVSRGEIFYIVIPKILNSANDEDLIKIVYEMKPLWSNAEKYHVGAKILEKTVERLASKKIKLDFDEKYLASGLFPSHSVILSLMSSGYIICSAFFSEIGMKKMLDKTIEMQEHYKIDATAEEKERVRMLCMVAESLNKENKKVWIFDRIEEKNIFIGQYNQSFVWLSSEILKSGFHRALATYLHELDHKYGNDYSSEFSYALTNTLEDVIQKSIYNPELYCKLNSNWNESLKREFF